MTESGAGVICGIESAVSDWERFNPSTNRVSELDKIPRGNATIRRSMLSFWISCDSISNLVKALLVVTKRLPLLVRPYIKTAGSTRGLPSSSVSCSGQGRRAAGVDLEDDESDWVTKVGCTNRCNSSICWFKRDTVNIASWNSSCIVLISRLLRIIERWVAASKRLNFAFRPLSTLKRASKIDLSQNVNSGLIPGRRCGIFKLRIMWRR